LTLWEKDVLAWYIPMIDLQNADATFDGTPMYISDEHNAETEYNHISFKPGVYDECSAFWISIMGHELVHVGQYRNGMTRWTYLLSPSTYEEPAYAMQDRI